MKTESKTSQSEIQDQIDSWLAAVREGELDRIMAHYASDVIAFDAIVQLRFKGVTAYRKHWEFCLAQCSGPLEFELRETEIIVDKEIAFAHYLVRCPSASGEEGENTGWMRATIAYRRIEGSWKIIHEHYSAPFDPETNQALFNLPLT